METNTSKTINSGRLVVTRKTTGYIDLRYVPLFPNPERPTSSEYPLPTGKSWQGIFTINCS